MRLLVGLDTNSGSLVPVYANVSFVNGKLFVQQAEPLDPDDIARFNITTIIQQGGGSTGSLIVASVKQIHQTTAIAGTVFFNVASDGLYRITAGCIDFTGSPTFEVFSTNLGTILPSSTGNAAEDAVVVMKSGDQVSYSVTTGAGSYDYSFYAVIEQLLV